MPRRSVDMRTVPGFLQVSYVQGKVNYFPSLTVVDEDIQLYVPLIDELLTAADQETVTSKEIRQRLENELGRDLHHQKVSPKRQPSNLTIPCTYVHVLDYLTNYRKR